MAPFFVFSLSLFLFVAALCSLCPLGREGSAKTGGIFGQIRFSCSLRGEELRRKEKREKRRKRKKERKEEKRERERAKRRGASGTPPDGSETRRRP